MPDDPPNVSEHGPPVTEKPRSTVSRRSFIQTMGVSAAAGALAGQAERAAAESADDGPPILGPDPVAITLNVNGKPARVTVEPATTLLEALRLHLNLTGSKEICGRGECGGCSVLIDGLLMSSCMMLAVDAAGTEITTIEGLAEGDKLDPIQESFIRHDGMQCGYCTPGMVIAAKALLNDNPRPTLDEIKRGMSGNYCRCGAHPNIFNAVLDASGQEPIHDRGGR